MSLPLQSGEANCFGESPSQVVGFLEMDRSTFTWVWLGGKWITAFWHHHITIYDRPAIVIFFKQHLDRLLEIIYVVPRGRRKECELPDFQPHSSVSLCFRSRSQFWLTHPPQEVRPGLKDLGETRIQGASWGLGRLWGEFGPGNRCEFEWTALLGDILGMSPESRWLQ